MEKQFITAKEAYILTDSGYVMDFVMENIKQKAVSGFDHLLIEIAKDDVVEKLKELGYEVEERIPERKLHLISWRCR